MINLNTPRPISLRYFFPLPRSAQTLALMIKMVECVVLRSFANLLHIVLQREWEELDRKQNWARLPPQWVPGQSAWALCPLGVHLPRGLNDPDPYVCQAQTKTLYLCGTTC